MAPQREPAAQLGHELGQQGLDDIRQAVQRGLPDAELPAGQLTRRREIPGASRWAKER
ncbi:hypothetical protein [Streptomyces sp.]|uniref:hypothetical protein n=1 Tax=Streptomyces sp. TaxID=1931 RepID=UPI002F3FBA83